MMVEIIRRHFRAATLLGLALLAAGLFLSGLGTAVQIKSNGASIMTPTSDARKTPPTEKPPDARIAELKALGIHLVNKWCVAPCSSDVIPSIRLSDFIQAVGPPEKVFSLFAGPDFIVELIYADKGYIAHARRPIAENYTDMTPDMSIGRIDLYNARSLSGLSQELLSWEKVHIPFEKAQDWAGFGPVKRLTE